jgi:CRISPR/Cas system CSM-associated protein Csm5 (group 7 of RAMP superfamily)
MNNTVKLGEIVFCDLTIIHKKTKYELKKVVYKNDGNLFYKPIYLDKLNIKEPVKVENIKIIARLGFENKTKSFTKVKGNDEKRNKITGTYE